MITLFFDKFSEVPLYEQLYNYIKKAIENRELSANEKLPSKRQLAAHLKVSVITVESAYNQLMVEGYIKSKPRSGFFVLPYVSLKPMYTNEKTTLIQKNRIVRDYEIDFRTNRVDRIHFPYSVLAKIERDILLDEYQNQINNMDYQGFYELREQISDFLFEYRGIETKPQSIVIGSGSEYLVSLLILLLGRERTYGVEEPGYLKNYRIYKDYGAKAKTVGLDNNGININLIKDIDIIHVTPSHQFPKGIVTTISRRMELLNWAYKKDFRYIIEDDYDSEFRFSGNPIPAMKGMDEFDKVIYMNSFSKSIAPSFRVSFMVLPDKLMNKYHNLFAYFTCSVPMITQMVLERFIKLREYEKHLNRMKNLYKNKRDFLIQKIESSSFGDKVKIIGAEAGLHFLIKLNTDISLKKLISAAKDKGVRLKGINEYYLKNERKIHEKLIVIGYSHLEDKDFIKAISLLEKAWTNIL